MNSSSDKEKSAFESVLSVLEKAEAFALAVGYWELRDKASAAAKKLDQVAEQKFKEGFAHGESAIMAKLASAELPEPAIKACQYKWNNGENGGVEMHPTPVTGYTADQLRQAYAQGAAAQLAEKPMGYFDDDGNFEDSYKDWMKDDAGAGWQAVYTRRQA